MNKLNPEHNPSKESIYCIGFVNAVRGRDIKVKVFKNKNHPYIVYDGKASRGVTVNNYVKIRKGTTVLVGKIEGEYIEEEYDEHTSQRYRREDANLSRFLDVSLLGHYEAGKLKKGIKEMPLIGNECYVLDEDDFAKLHDFYDEGEKAVEIGKLGENSTHPVKVGIDKLFASHIGIFGNTGSGKSNTLARIYTELFKERGNWSDFQKSQFIFIDFNGEYTTNSVLSQSKEVLSLNTRKENGEDKYPIREQVLKDPEILSVILHATEKTQKPFLAGVLSNDFLENPDNYSSSVNKTIKRVIDREQVKNGVGKIVNFLRKIKPYVTQDSQEEIKEVEQEIEDNLSQDAKRSFMWNGDYDDEGSLEIWREKIKPYLDDLTFRGGLGAVENIELTIYLHYYHKLSYSGINTDFVEPLINRVESKFQTLNKLIKVEEHPPENNILVVSLRNVRLEMKKILPLMICKHLYQNQKHKMSDESLHIIVDEAHNILSEQSEREREEWKDYRLETFEEIIKEGRKFDTFLSVVSQRPYDVSHTIISQLHNYFIHRLINNRDIKALEKAVSYLDKSSFESIPILSVGNCFLAGLATDIPVKVSIDLLKKEMQPESDTINLVESWQ